MKILPRPVMSANCHAVLRGAFALGLLLLPAFLPPAGSREPEPAVMLERVEPWSNLFGGQDVVYQFVIRAPAQFQGNARWVFSTVDGRTLPGGRGEAAVVAGPGRPAQVKVSLRVPETREGVVLETRLSLGVYRDGAAQPAARTQGILWIFPPDPFTGREQWLKGLNLTLFDPEKKTASTLQKANIPFSSVRTADALKELRRGVVVIGEGVSFREERGLAEVLLKLAARGVPVLCLAPAGGEFPLPGAANSPGPVPGTLSLSHQDVIARLDRRLDARAWPPDGRVVASRLLLRGEGTAVVAEVSRGEDGWPWLEVSFPEQKSRLIVCGFALIEKWDSGPMPRYLLASLLEQLARRRLPEP